jgi:hypothetical protein
LKKFNSILVLIIVFGSIFLSCTKTATGLVGPAGPQGLTGANGADTPNAITGFVNLYDQYGNKVSSFAGLNVSTKTHDSLVSTVTDSIGNFRLSGLIIGTYDLLFKGNSYDSIMVHVDNSGGNEDKFIGIVNVNQQVVTHILSENVSVVQGPFYVYDSILTLQLYITIDGPPLSFTTRRDFGFYFSRSNQVNMNQYDLAINTYGNSLMSNNNIFPYAYSLFNFTSSNIIYQPGDTVYFKTYVLPVNGKLTTWFNYSDYQTINYPYVGDSTLNYFIWP